MIRPPADPPAIVVLDVDTCVPARAASFVADGLARGYLVEARSDDLEPGWVSIRWWAKGASPR